jgi:uncharacterized membrane protein
MYIPVHTMFEYTCLNMYPCSRCFQCEAPTDPSPLHLMSRTAFLLAALLSGHGLRKRSLSPSGALAAFVVGYSMMSIELKTFGWTLIAFYLLGSRATKVGASLKQKLEEGHDSAGGGYRTAWQVLCNSLNALIYAMAWDILFSSNSISRPWLPQAATPSVNHVYDSSAWCAVGGGASAPDRWSNSLVLAAMAHFACCLGDTFASELGILSKSPPRLITTMAVVPPGTNGAVSVLGTVVSALGGLVVGIVTTLCLFIESPACRDTSIARGMVLHVLTWGTLSGFTGSMVA